MRIPYGLALLVVGALLLGGCPGMETIDDPATPGKPGQGIAGPQGETGEQGETGPQGERGPAGPTELIFWGTFGGFPPAVVLETGGPVRLLDFVRVSEGAYRVVLDRPYDPDGGAAVFVSSDGSVVTSGSASAHVVTVVGWSQESVTGGRLVIEVTAISIGNDDILIGLYADNSDAVFTMQVYDADAP